MIDCVLCKTLIRLVPKARKVSVALPRRVIELNQKLAWMNDNHYVCQEFVECHQTFSLKIQPPTEKLFQSQKNMKWLKKGHDSNDYAYVVWFRMNLCMCVPNHPGLSWRLSQRDVQYGMTIVLFSTPTASGSIIVVGTAFSQDLAIIWKSTCFKSHRVFWGIYGSDGGGGRPVHMEQLSSLRGGSIILSVRPRTPDRGYGSVMGTTSYSRSRVRKCYRYDLLLPIEGRKPESFLAWISSKKKLKKTQNKMG